MYVCCPDVTGLERDVIIMKEGMMRLTAEYIRQMASSSQVYYRGMRYYAAHAVSHVTWNESKRQYHAMVQGGNQYMVTIQQKDDASELGYSCNCPAHVKYSGACKHVIATLLFIADYQQRETVGSQLKGEDRKAYEIISYFRKREYRHLEPRYYRVGLRISVPGMLKKQNSRAYVSLYAGDEKQYKVPNSKKFISEYYEEKTIELGKHFRFIPGECEFEPVSKRVMEYLCEIYEIQETLGKTYYSNLFNRQELVLSKSMLRRLLELGGGLDCELSLSQGEFHPVSIIHGNPELNLELEMGEDSIVLKNRKDHSLSSLTDSGDILYYDGNIYLPDQEYINKLLPFYSSVFASREQSVEFRAENKQNFVEKVLPVIQKSMNVEVPSELRDNYVVEPLHARLYLDVEHKKNRYHLLARLIFVYGKYEMNPLEEDTFSKPVILVRDREEEQQLILDIYSHHFKLQDDHFIMQHEDAIYEFLTEGVKTLKDRFEIFYSKEYKGLHVRKMGNLRATVRLDTDIDMLEMNLGYAQIPKEELEELFRAITLKKKYYRLKNGDFIDLSEQDVHVQNLAWLLENSAQRGGEGIVRFERSTAGYLENMLAKGSVIDREESYEKLLQSLRHPELQSWPVPEEVQARLRPYQVVGYQWLKTLAHYGLGGILADDMGLGKTLQAIVYICSRPGKKHLIVCPTSLAYNWQEEFQKFAPHVATCVVEGSPQLRMEKIFDNQYDVWITTYPLIRRDNKLYQTKAYDTVFLDEAQFIKNADSLGAKAAKSLHAKHRFGLTGTPIENSLAELWSLFDFVMPGFLPKYRRYMEYYEKPILREENHQRMRELRMKIQPFVLRRMKNDVLDDLPDKMETRRLVAMTSKQRKLYLSYLSRVQLEIAHQEELISKGKHVDGQGRVQILSALTRLRQICCHPGTFIENYTGGSGKLDVLMEMLPDILMGGHHVVLFSQFTSMLSMIADKLQEEGISYYILQGSTPVDERRKMVRSFNQGEVPVFLVSLKAGGTGLNLIGADTVIHYDPWWNPAVEDQATDRAYRIGQKRKVRVIKLITQDSIEEKIDALQQKKKELSETVIEKGEVFVNQLTMEEIKKLFTED